MTGRMGKVDSHIRCPWCCISENNSRWLLGDELGYWLIWNAQRLQRKCIKFEMIYPVSSIYFVYSSCWSSFAPSCRGHSSLNLPVLRVSIRGCFKNIWSCKTAHVPASWVPWHRKINLHSSEFTNVQSWPFCIDLCRVETCIQRILTSTTPTMIYLQKRAKLVNLTQN